MIHVVPRASQGSPFTRLTWFPPSNLGTRMRATAPPATRARERNVKSTVSSRPTMTWCWVISGRFGAFAEEPWPLVEEFKDYDYCEGGYDPEEVIRSGRDCR